MLRHYSGLPLEAQVSQCSTKNHFTASAAEIPDPGLNTITTKSDKWKYFYSEFSKDFRAVNPYKSI